MDKTELYEYLTNLWVDYLVFRDGVSEEKARLYLYIQIEDLKGVEDELDYIRVEFDNMADNDELSTKFYTRFDTAWNELNYLKTKYQIEEGE